MKGYAKTNPYYVPVSKKLYEEPLNKTMEWIGSDVNLTFPTTYFTDSSIAFSFILTMYGVGMCKDKADIPNLLQSWIDSIPLTASGEAQS